MNQEVACRLACPPCTGRLTAVRAIPAAGALGGFRVRRLANYLCQTIP